VCACACACARDERRKAHKKDQVTEVARKKRRAANKATARAITGVSLEVINKKRTEKPEVRARGGVMWVLGAGGSRGGRVSGAALRLSSKQAHGTRAAH
jgi:hypothetical protein